MKITVIGGSGFIGTNLVEVLKDNFQVKIVDKQMSHFFPELTTIADICNIDELRNAIEPTDIIVNLAAEHRDDVSPKSLYYDVNVQGTKNILKVMDEKGIKTIFFTSSVAVYGLNKVNPNEEHPVDPFNDYGITKYQAEEVLREWFEKDKNNNNLFILRPTVVFGPRNRGNVYNLLNQIASGKFMMIGSGQNKKSMAYVQNIVGFIKFSIEKDNYTGYHLYNYIDKADLSTIELVKVAETATGKKLSPIRIPYALGYLGGLVLMLWQK
ncbi:NAD-dependent epimerase/dehydratase family protein [Rhizosphaericola mali]|uniref:NAD-dependent epimerase/dehydratase family protein n=1 Tax=Rhizosphaericola mali TaxID=2545455 RepID=UPI001CDA5054|nr:NAD-dependent epimerase/dehydratase family protein [Rhizosphaericola mali]